MARQLEAQGEPIAFLALFDTFVDPGFEPDDAEVLARWALDHIPGCRADWRTLTPGGQLAHVLDRARATGEMILVLAYLEALRILPFYRVQYHARHAYGPRPYSGHVTLFRVDKPDWAPPAPDMGWAALAAGGVTIYDMPGRHLTMMEPPYVDVLAAQLRACLEQ
jgi:thioesterase domain-containing protein